MSALAQALMVAAAAVVFALGALHLLYTFRGDKLHPRDEALLARMQEVPPVITRQTTMWKAWVGFNASHSGGALLFGAVYGYLALVHPGVLFQSWFLRALGLLLLAGYVVLAQRYWFRAPLRGIVLALGLYAASLILAGP